MYSKGLDTRTSRDDCIQGPSNKGLGTVIPTQGALYKYLFITTFFRRVFKGLYIKNVQYFKVLYTGAL